MHLSSPQVAGSSEFTPELKSQELKIKAVFILNKKKFIRTNSRTTSPHLRQVRIQMMTSLITGTRLLLAGSSAASQPAISTAPGCGGSPELLAAPTVSSRSIRCAPRAPGRISAGASRRSPGLPPVQHLDPETVAERARTTQSQLGLSENGVNVK